MDNKFKIVAKLVTSIQSGKNTIKATNRYSVKALNEIIKLYFKNNIVYPANPNTYLPYPIYLHHNTQTKEIYYSSYKNNNEKTITFNINEGGLYEVKEALNRMYSNDNKLNL